MKRLLIVDGSNLLFQMFFGMPARIVNEQGKAIHGTLGFVGALLKIIDRTEPTHMVVLFDSRNKFGIEPEQYADFKSLVGDPSDNIKGADKVGPKTAALLLNEFGNLENIMANPESIKRTFIQESIIRNTEKLRTNYKIIKLENAVPLPFTLEELVYQYNGITTNEVLKGIGLR